MGTNFYCVKINSTEELHIGKRSCGWQFIFQANGINCHVPWQSNLESLIQYLKSDKDIRIIDEYDRIYSVDDFLSEIKDSLYHDKNHININDIEDNVDQFNLLATEYESIDGTRWCSSDFS